MTQPYQIDPNDLTQTITCPYCEQPITGDALHLMAHGIACRQQWEIKQQSIQNNSNNDKAAKGSSTIG